MTVRGKVKNGVIVLDNGSTLPEGAEVEVRQVLKKKPAARTGKKRPGLSRKVSKEPKSVSERLASVIGRATTLPPDMSENVDHYLYGAPKRRS